MAASVKTCLTAGHVVCVADPPTRTASERAAAEESETAEASTEVRQTGRPGSSLSCRCMYLVHHEWNFVIFGFIPKQI